MLKFCEKYELPKCPQTDYWSVWYQPRLYPIWRLNQYWRDIASTSSINSSKKRTRHINLSQWWPAVSHGSIFEHWVVFNSLISCSLSSSWYPQLWNTNTRIVLEPKFLDQSYLHVFHAYKVTLYKSLLDQLSKQLIRDLDHCTAPRVGSQDPFFIQLLFCNCLNW